MIEAFLFVVLISYGVCQNGIVELNLVQVPKYYTPFNDDIFIAGTFNNWITDDSRYKFDKVTHNTYKITLNLPLGTYQYKITRGSWDTVETNLDGSFLQNRNLQVNSGSQTYTIGVENWEDFKGYHSTTGNVIMLDRSYPYPQFNNTKRIWVYLPNDYYRTTQSYPVIYMHDGQNLFDTRYSAYGSEWGIDEIMEQFFNQNKPTVIVVGIETTVNRVDELTPYTHPDRGGGKADLYVDFLVNYLKPYIDNKFRTKPQREFTGIWGSSNGGLFSFYAGLKNQNVFSKFGIFSPSFWFNNTIYDFALSTPSQYDDQRLYFFCGTLETSYPTMVEDMLKMMNLLTIKGYKHMKSSVATDGLHHEYYWGREFPTAYEWLFL